MINRIVGRAVGLVKQTQQWGGLPVSVRSKHKQVPEEP
jgi:hypothetical protein